MGSGDAIDVDFVFAYGSNLDRQDLCLWASKNGHTFDECVIEYIPAYLPKYRLIWNYLSPVRQGGAANVEPAPDSVVYGAILKVSKKGILLLDQKEGHPRRYHRGNQRISCLTHREKKEIYCWVYCVLPEWHENFPVRPTNDYLAIVLKGIRDMGWGPEIQKSLMASVPN
ncbi:MAG: gamma-glutamylcyclotransferase family protein [Myxococcota bacterium]|nr:gamma-glutamylcyclotransferase family protein [Myxococcota bacterium]